MTDTKAPPERVWLSTLAMVNADRRDFHAHVTTYKLDDSDVEYIRANLASRSAGVNARAAAEEIRQFFDPWLIDHDSVEQKVEQIILKHCGAASVPAPAEQSFYVVSDTWMGRSLHICRSRQEAERGQYLETLATQGYDEESDQSEVTQEQFRAWPVSAWPEHLEFEEAFDWIGDRAAATPAEVSTGEARVRGLVVMSALVNFIDWLDAQRMMILPAEERGGLVKDFLDAHQEGQNYFMQAEQIATALGVPFESSEPVAQLVTCPKCLVERVAETIIRGLCWHCRTAEIPETIEKPR